MWHICHSRRERVNLKNNKPQSYINLAVMIWESTCDESATQYHWFYHYVLPGRRDGRPSARDQTWPFHRGNEIRQKICPRGWHQKIRNVLTDPSTEQRIWKQFHVSWSFSYSASSTDWRHVSWSFSYSATSSQYWLEIGKFAESPISIL